LEKVEIALDIFPIEKSVYKQMCYITLNTYFGKVEEWPGVIPKVFNVKHSLRVRQVRIFNS